MGDVNLLSQARFYNGGMKVSREEECLIKELPREKVVTVGQRFDGGWRFQGCFTGTSAQAYKADSGILWHQRLAHLGCDNLMKMKADEMVTGLSATG
jgi:hypothetical protein